MKKRSIFAAATAVAVFATAAYAYTLDLTTGIGFVGKGEVQIALGWNNHQLQAGAGSLEFTYVASEEYSAVCTFVTGEGTRGETTHNVARTRTSSVNNTIAYDARRANQINGFNLTGFTSTSYTGDELPVVGGACSGGGPEGGQWTSVQLISSSGGLYVNGVLIP